MDVHTTLLQVTYYGGAGALEMFSPDRTWETIGNLPRRGPRFSLHRKLDGTTTIYSSNW